MWYNCIWIGIAKLSLLRTGYFSLAANVLKSSQKIWHVNKRDVLRLNWLGSDQWIRQRCFDSDLNSAWARSSCCLSKGPLKRDFLENYLTTFSEAVVSEIQNIWGSPFFFKYLSFILDFKNASKNWEKIFRFWYNCIWIGMVKLPLLRKGFLSPAANVLRSSPKIWHVKNRDFFQFNWLGSDQSIW